MTRLFVILACLNTAALVTTIGYGIYSKFFDHSVYLTHFTLGLFSAIGTLLVHCIIFTYFLGTGRWVKEVGLVYQLPDENLPKLTRELKRTSFPPALFAMLIVIGTGAAGAGQQLQEWPWEFHAILAACTMVINLWAYWIEYRCVQMNAKVISDVLDEVDRIRAERGLSTNAEALESQRQS